LSCNHSRGPNHDPIITSLEIPSSLPAGYSTTFACTVSDSDGDAVTYQWNSTAGTLEPSISNEAYWTAPETSGPVRIMLTVQDARGGSDVRHDTVMVIPDTETLIDWPGAVPGGDYRLWNAHFRAGYTVSGSFSAGGQDITFLMLDSLNYWRWRFNESCDCEVKVERSAGSSFSAGISTDGLGVFILDNRYNADPDTAVHVFIRRTSP
jgi:hypothetical protein